MSRQEKKSESLEIRLPYSQKQAFMQACQEKGTTASDTLRRLIAEDLDRDAGSHKERTWMMTLKQNPLKAAASALAVLMSGGVFVAGTSVADEKLFDKLDVNKDGELTDWEFDRNLGRSNGYRALFDALDVDGSGRIGREEFREEGEIVQRGEETVEVDGEKHRRITFAYITFDLATEDGGTSVGITSDKRSVGIYAPRAEVERLYTEMLEEAQVTESRGMPEPPAPPEPGRD